MGAVPARVEWRRGVFFAGLLAYVAVLGTVHQPHVHYFYDAVAIRDMCTVWSSLSWKPGDERHFLPAAILGQHEGALQWVVLNAYCHLVGDLLPLSPRTMQLPNTVLTVLAAVIAWRLGRRIHSERLGYLTALMLVLMPWLGVTIRLPWVFNLLSVLTQLLTVSAFVGFVLEPDRRLYRVAAPLALALYLTAAPDWPMFVFVLALFLLLTRRLRHALGNVHNAYPLAVLTVYAGWTAALWAYGHFWAPARAHLWQRSILVFPFFKVGTMAWPSPGRVVEYAAETFGLILLLAAAGLVAVWRGTAPGEARADAAARMKTRLLLALATWAALAAVLLFRTSSSVTFGYVIAVPLAVLAAFALRRARPALVALVVVALVAIQVQGVARRVARADNVDDRRVLAVAAFLIEQRPDLLAPGKAALLPRNEAANVGQYARGRNERLVMPVDFPVELYVHSVASKVEVLRDFVDAYNGRGEIKADWLILSSEVLSDRTPAAAFYRRLRADSRVHWIAAFTDRRGRALWLGEVRAAGAPAGEPKAYDVDALAQVYARKYDRLSFLRRNVRYVMHD